MTESASSCKSHNFETYGKEVSYVKKGITVEYQVQREISQGSNRSMLQPSLVPRCSEKSERRAWYPQFMHT